MGDSPKLPADCQIHGSDADRAFLYVHGLGGTKEDALSFAARAADHGWQVVSVGLPSTLQPWDCVPFLSEGFDAMRLRWSRIGLRATSIGAWFSLQALDSQRVEQALLQSPLVDMVGMIEGMMAATGVARDQLEEAGELPGPGDNVLSWRYLRWAEEHPVDRWHAPTSIIVGDADELLMAGSVERFAGAVGADVTMVAGGAHWLHQPKELEVLARWEARALKGLDRPPPEATPA